MTGITSFIIQYSNVQFSQLLGASVDLIVTEGDGDNSPLITNQLSASEIAQLIAQGKYVAGYVNVGVTDSSRDYWQNAWTENSPNGIGEDDQNALTTNAPAFLTGAPSNGFGYLVDFTSADWQQIVIDQAKYLVGTRGYNAVFLDDVSAYFARAAGLYDLSTPQGIQQLRNLADAMAAFIEDIKAAVVAENPNAILVANTDPYFLDNTIGGIGSTAANSFLQSVDVHILENMHNRAALDRSLVSLAGQTVLIAQTDGSMPQFSAGVGAINEQDLRLYGSTWVSGDVFYSSFVPFSPSGERLLGDISDNILSGNTGDDTLLGGLGDDEMSGGLGDDVYLIDSLSDIVTELAGEGTDRLYSSINLNPFGNRYANIEEFALIGSANAIHTTDLGETIYANPDIASKLFAYGGDDTLIGSTGNDKLYGGLGADILNGGEGRDRLDGGGDADAMTGGAGDDRYFVDNLGDTVTELADEGTDLVKSTVDWTLGDHLENLRLGPSAAEGIGNDLDNAIFATGQATLRGNDGNDTMRGSNFDDQLFGNDGNDNINGRAGNDTINGGRGDDFIKGRAGEDTINGGSGNDLIIGGKDNDMISGGSDQDELKGEGGADTFAFADGDFAGLTDATADRITDFSQSDGDVIDLSAVDAIIGGGDDAFTFIADAAFSGTAGELRFEQADGNTMVFMDVDGDGAADFAIRLDGTINLAEADFVL